MKVISKRPKLIIIDDLEDPELTDDTETRDKIKKWFHTVFKVSSDEEFKEL